MRYSTLILTAALALPLSAQYKIDSAGAPPSEVPAAISQMLQKDGIKVLSGSGSVSCELWFRTTAPSGPKSSDPDQALATVPPGSFMGVMRLPAAGSDRRGQRIAAGVYTLRYALHPVNGAHLGVAPQRDFLLLVPVADDKDPNENLDFETVVKMSTKASGTPHPAVFSVTSSNHEKNPDIGMEGDSDWVVYTKVGNLPIALIVVGQAQG
jgi:hypothetical protein